MKKIIRNNIFMNLLLMVVFVWLNNEALKNGLEETFVLLAFIYGIFIVAANAFFVVKFCKKI